MLTPPAPPRKPASLLLIYSMGLLTGLAMMAVVELLLPSALEEDVLYYREVRGLVNESFVREIGERELLDRALQGMLESLDPYSRYYIDDDATRVDRETRGEFRGVGVVFKSPVRAGQVLFPLEDTPASRAGIRVGDRILEVNGAAVSEMEDGGLQTSLHDPERERIEVTVVGLDGVRRELEIEPEQVVDPTIRHVRMVNSELGIGFLAIRSFSRRTTGEFDAAIAWLRSQGMRALVLDLRNNPGGVLDSSLAIANRFIPEGVLLTTASREGTDSTLAKDDRCTLEGLPLVVLVGSSSASASEVLAGALQDHRAGVLVGNPTYGKGAVQTLARYEGLDAIVKLTTSYYLTPAQRVIERGLTGAGEAGLPPDLNVELGTEELRSIHDFLARYSPPPSARAALEDWERESGEQLIAQAPDDLQLQAALGLLTGSITLHTP